MITSWAIKLNNRFQYSIIQLAHFLKIFMLIIAVWKILSEDIIVSATFVDDLIENIFKA